MSGKTAAFGVGSFHFAWEPPKGAKDQQPTVEQYVKAVTNALNAIPTIKKVEIDHEEYVGDDLGVASPLPDWSEGEGFYPGFDYFKLTFEVFMPRRLQDELLHKTDDAAGTERFRIYQTYGYEAPVTFIRPLAPTGDHAPSTSVRLVRDYLKREFATSRDGISFQCLGPSPLHADFFLRDNAQGLTPDYPFIATVETPAGYDQVEIWYDPNLHRSVEAAFDNLLFELTPQLSDCYAVYAGNARAVNAWDVLSHDLDTLLNRGKVSRPRRIWRALWRGQALAKLHQTIAEFEADAVDNANFIERTRKQLVRSKPIIPLKPLLDVAVDDCERFALRQVEKLVGHVEARRYNQLTLIVALAAAIIGGVVGAFIQARLAQ